MEDWAEIRRLHRAEGMAIKAITRRLGVSRNTVRRALAAHEPPRYERARRGSIVDAVEPQIRVLLRPSVDFLREKSGRQPQDLIRPPQLAILALQLRDPRLLHRHRLRRGRSARRTALLGAVHPVPQRFGVHTQLAGDLGDRSTPRAEFAFKLTHHRHGTFLHFNRVLARCCHAVHPSQNQWPPTNPVRSIDSA
jgi:hypothetical protein